MKNGVKHYERIFEEQKIIEDFQSLVSYLVLVTFFLLSVYDLCK